MAAQGDPVRVKLKYDRGTFLQKFAANVTRGGVFLPSRTTRGVGETIRFEIVLGDGQVGLSGEGKVSWAKPYDAAQPNKAYGMGVQFTAIDEAARPTLDALLAHKEGRPAPPPPPPSPAATTSAPKPPPPPSRAGSAYPAERAPAPADEVESWVEETAARRALDRARVLATMTDKNALEALLQPEPEDAVSLSQALLDLPRLVSGRKSGMFRIPTVDDGKR